MSKRNDPSSPAAAVAPDAVVAARARARRRLIGATVLLAIGVVGFPLLFETQPRPIPLDIPIEIPRKDNAAALTLPPNRPVPASAAESAQALAEPPATALAARQPLAQASAAASQPAAASAPRPDKTVAVRDDDGRRALALLEGKAAASPINTAPEAATKATPQAEQRVVVQVGAYTEADKLREARQKVEQLGLKTYTQVIEGDGAKRTRVRVGPFTSRQEAEKAVARIKAAGLPAAILIL